MPHTRSHIFLILSAFLTLLAPSLFCELNQNPGQETSEQVHQAVVPFQPNGLHRFTKIIGGLRNATPQSASAKAKAMRFFSSLYNTDNLEQRELLDTFVQQLSSIIKKKWSDTRSKDTKLVVLIEDTKQAFETILLEEDVSTIELVNKMMQELFTAVSPTLGDFLASVKRTTIILASVGVVCLVTWGAYELYQRLHKKLITENIEWANEHLATIQTEYQDLFTYLRGMRLNETLEGFQQLSTVLQEVSQSALLPQMNAAAAASLRNQDAVLRSAGYPNGRQTTDFVQRVVDVIDRPGQNEVNARSSRNDQYGHPLYTITEFEPDPTNPQNMIRSDLELQRLTFGGRTFYREYATHRWSIDPQGNHTEINYIAAQEQLEWGVLHSTTQTLSQHPNPRTGEHDVVRFEPSALDALGTIAQSGVLQAVARQMDTNQTEAAHIYGFHGFTPGMRNATPADLAFAQIDQYQVPVFLSRTRRRDGTDIAPGQLQTTPQTDRLPIVLQPGVSGMIASLANERSPLAQTLRTLAPILRNPLSLGDQIGRGVRPYIPSFTEIWSGTHQTEPRDPRAVIDPAALQAEIQRYAVDPATYHQNRLMFLTPPAAAGAATTGAPPASLPMPTPSPVPVTSTTT